MAITSTLIGSLGAGKVTESRFWFRNSRRYCSDLDKAWDIPSGRHLFFWQGIRSNGLSGWITLDGTEHSVDGSSGSLVGGYFYVDGPKTIQATGRGSGAFGEDPYANWVKVAS